MTFTDPGSATYSAYPGIATGSMTPAPYASIQLTLSEATFTYDEECANRCIVNLNKVATPAVTTRETSTYGICSILEQW